MYNCEKCGKVFEKKIALCGHMAVCKEEKKECPICNKIFRPTCIKKHIESHKHDKKCLNCEKEIRGKDRKFCSQKCNAIYNNRNRSRYKYETIRDENGSIIKYVRELPKCINCGKEIDNNGIKFCSNKCQQNYKNKNFDCYVDVNKKFPDGTGQVRIKKYFIRKRGHKCEICGLEQWRDQLIPLVLDHIDGNSDNIEFNNFRLVCCNCDAQLPTYKGKNKGNGRFSRRQRYKEGKSF